MEVLPLLLTGATGAAIVALLDHVIQWALGRKAKKDDARELDVASWHDDTDQKINALVAGQKYILLDRIQYLARAYIRDGEISFDDRRRLHQMHDAYHNLGGNGDLDTLMEQVDELPLKDN